MEEKNLDQNNASKEELKDFSNNLEESSTTYAKTNQKNGFCVTSFALSIYSICSIIVLLIIGILSSIAFLMPDPASNIGKIFKTFNSLLFIHSIIIPTISTILGIIGLNKQITSKLGVAGITISLIILVPAILICINT